MDFENQIEKILKDIQDREDREMAYELVKRLSPLFTANGVAVKATKYNLCDQVEVKESCSVDKFNKELVMHYGISIDGLDFTKHDKKFNDEIEDLRKELRESKDYITQLKHDLEEKCSFETERLVKLPFDPLETANMLINATYKAEIPFLEKQVDRNVYGIDDLEQIAEHLLVYCKHNREDEE